MIGASPVVMSLHLQLRAALADPPALLALRASGLVAGHVSVLASPEVVLVPPHPNRRGWRMTLEVSCRLDLVVSIRLNQSVPGW